MLYLAQVQKHKDSGDTFIHLLACQRAEHAWTVIKDDAIILPAQVNGYGEGSLVLADVTEAQSIIRLDSAKDWVLEILQQFLITGITPEFLQQETERAEQWRQSLTLQSQELDRRTLELEARREQIQILEESLKREKKALSSQNEDLERRKQDLIREEQQDERNSA